MVDGRDGLPGGAQGQPPAFDRQNQPGDEQDGQTGQNEFQNQERLTKCFEIEWSCAGFHYRDRHREVGGRIVLIGYLARACKRKLVGGRFELDPTDPGEEYFHPGMGIRFHNHEAMGSVIVATAGKSRHQAGRDANRATITAMVVANSHNSLFAGQIENNPLHPAQWASRVPAGCRGKLAQVILDRHHLVVRGGLGYGQADRQVTHPFGQFVRRDSGNFGSSWDNSSRHDAVGPR